MYRFLISCGLLLLCVPPTQARPPRYDAVYEVTDPRATRSFSGIWTRPDGVRILVVVKKPKREVTVYPALMDVPYAPSVRPSSYRERPVPQPVIITNPFVKE